MTTEITRTGWIDSHCHLQDLDDPSDALARAHAEGVAGAICVGTSAPSSRRALALAEELATAGEMVWASAGLHPHDAKDDLEALEAVLGEYTGIHDVSSRNAGSLVAIGECGLDYFYEHSPRTDQRDAFARQIALAKQYDLALIVHTRDAWDDTVAVLHSEGVPERIVIHCFTGGPDEARRCLDLGAYLSFSGIVTFKNAQDLREAAKLCPSDRLLVETDAPYLAPVPHRGRPNEPAFVALVGSSIAELRGEDAVDLAITASANTTACFALS